MDRKVWQTVKDSGKLPTMPGVAVRMLEVLQQPEVSIGAVADAVSQDPALVSRLLRLVNSPFYGFASSISTVSRALVVLGLNKTKYLVLSFSLVAYVNGGKRDGFDYGGYWKRSLTSAVAAKMLAELTGFDLREEAFVCGLLQDIGVLALQQCLPDKYTEVMELRKADGVELCEAEQRVLNTTHAELTAALAREWGLPDILVTPAVYHHDYLAADEQQPDIRMMTRVAYLAGFVSRIFCEDGGVTKSEVFAQQAAELFGLTHAQVVDFLNDIDSQVRMAASLFEAPVHDYCSYMELLEVANQELAKLGMASQTALEMARLRQEADERAQQVTALGKSASPEATLDSLTGVNNYGAFQKALERELSRARRFHHSLALLTVDIDDFAATNEKYGRNIGDWLLVQMAQILKGCVRGMDIVGRVGGEQFGLILLEPSQAVTKIVANRVRKRLAEHTFGALSDLISITVSVGAVHCASNGTPATRAEIAGAAQETLRRAKENGKNCCCFATLGSQPA